MLKINYLVIVLSFVFVFILGWFLKRMGKNEDYNNFKIERYSANICERPFRATCNRDKIFSRIIYSHRNLSVIKPSILLYIKGVICICNFPFFNN